MRTSSSRPRVRASRRAARAPTRQETRARQPLRAGSTSTRRLRPRAQAARPRPTRNGWNNTDVTVHFTGTDALSEIDFCDAAVVLFGRGCEPVGERHVHRQGRKREHVQPLRAGSTSTRPPGRSPTWDRRRARTATAGTRPTSSISFKASDGLSGQSPATASRIRRGGSHDRTRRPAAKARRSRSPPSNCTDLAGNTAAASDSAAFKIDKTAPTASASRSPAANGNGWNNTDVTVQLHGHGRAVGDRLLRCGRRRSPAEGAGQSASGTCTDKAGNVSAPATASGINIDKTDPVDRPTSARRRARTATAGTRPTSSTASRRPTGSRLTATAWRRSRTVAATASSRRRRAARAAVTVTSDGCSDLAGNSAAGGQRPASRSTRPPGHHRPWPTTSPNGNGWYKTDVVNQFKASDALSGLNAAARRPSRIRCRGVVGSRRRRAAKARRSPSTRATAPTSPATPRRP